MKHRVDVYSDGSIALVTELPGMTARVIKDDVGSPVETHDITAVELKSLETEDMSTVKFDSKKQELKVGKRKIMVKLNKKDTITGNDESIINTAPSNVSKYS